MKTAGSIVQLIAVLLLAAAVAGCASTQSRESTGGYVDSSVITAKAKAAIFDDPALKVLDIKVVTFKDTVQLSGFVNSTEMRDRAAVVVGRVSGVRSVKNDLIVK